MAPWSNITAQQKGEKLSGMHTTHTPEPDHSHSFHGISQHRPFEGLEALLPGCHQQIARDRIFALRRGPIRYSRGAMIAFEGEDADYSYMVASGAVRSCKTYRGGSRSIAAFYLPGELFGWSGGLIHALSLEAASDTTVLFFKRNALIAAAARDSSIASFLLAAITDELRRTQASLLLASKSAECRVVTFLIDLSTRVGNSNVLDLPMSHHDIADHLGLTIETLSRTITKLHNSGSIERASGRTLILRKPASLMQISD